MSRDRKAELEAYIQQETDAILQGEKLLAPEQVMERLGITRRQLMALHRGENSHGLYLPVIRLGKKTIRYRLVDVLRLEFESQQLSHDEF